MNTETRIVTITPDEVRDALREYIANAAADFLGLEYSQRKPENIIILNGDSLVIPTEGPSFRAEVVPVLEADPS